MSRMVKLSGVLYLVLAVGQYAGAQAVPTAPAPAGASAELLHTPAPVPVTPQTPSTPQTPTPPTLTAPGNTPGMPDLSNASLPPQEAGTEAAAGGFAPGMIGDSLAIVGTIKAPKGFSLSSSSSSSAGFGSRGGPPAFAVSGYKITDNESVLPQDRAYLTLNYFSSVDHSVVAPGGPDQRIARELFGYEKTFLDGDLSFGVRAPFIQTHNSDGFEASDVGDITLIGKYAFLRDRESGSAVSAGLALTLPTGPEYVVAIFPTTGGGATTFRLDPTVVQPYLGGLFNFGDFYVEAFTALAFYSNDNISTEWYNDVAVGYYAYRGQGQVRTIIPTLELHATTPFGHEGTDGFPVGQLDTLITTLGVHTVFRNNSDLTAAVEFPLGGPQPFSTELVLQFNYHF